MIGVPKIPAQREEERMNTRKTVLTVLVILLLVFYIVSMAYIQSLHRQIEDINSYRRSLRNRSSYYKSNTYAGPSPKPSAILRNALPPALDPQDGRSIPGQAQTAFTMRKTSTIGTKMILSTMRTRKNITTNMAETKQVPIVSSSSWKKRGADAPRPRSGRPESGKNRCSA